ncbi:hypothetical protein BMF94_1852 [Rhodotorula taiwanensis]|uniref:Uncharacterized protein n=1 Tax=Rhodotorula taiwanensis TaxID=741276 RepID=A0A2S5BEN5_9BASI|nr:hypothetical protein BMF94_1852 [Rhodotorula taiwanensis]
MRTNRHPGGAATLVTPAIAALLVVQTAFARPTRALSSRDVSSDTSGFYNPTLAVESSTAPLGEPVNVVISNASDARVLTEEGFYDYARSLNFSTNCGGILLGGTQSANLGDGMGMQQQVDILREDFGNLAGGTCEESLNGGNHIRLWRQNGTTADSGAWFLAASKEENATLHHMIIPDGYDIGRDNFVERAVSGRTVSPTSGRIFSAAAVNVSGNGYFADVSTSEINHGISTDGIVTVLTIHLCLCRFVFGGSCIIRDLRRGC